MAAKKKAEQKEIVDTKKEIDRSNTIAELLMHPTVQAGLTLDRWQPEINVVSATKKLIEQVNDVKKGDMSRPEAMLLSQAHTLDALFNSLAQKAFMQTHMPHYESFLRLAFKAQSQCRATLQALSDVKNPSVVYAKQANISSGHQQINNGISDPRTQELKNISNELLEHTHGERLDSRTKSEAVTGNTGMEALG